MSVFAKLLNCSQDQVLTKIIQMKEENITISNKLEVSRANLNLTKVILRQSLVCLKEINLKA